MCRPINFLIQNAKGIYVLGGIIVAVAGWFFIMQGIPERVSTLEKDVADLKTNIATQNTKLDMTLNAVYEIRSVLLKK